MITLIGTRWKRSNALSQGVLIAQVLLGNLEIIIRQLAEKNKYSSALSWWFVAGVTPLPIPNREVKPCRTDDTLFKGKVGSCQDCALELVQSHNKTLPVRAVFCYTWSI